MNYFKLQLGCYLIVLYIILIYVKETLHNKIPCNRIFDCMLWFSPLAIFFDGLTAWTVNHLDTVPLKLNLIFHAAFFITMTINLMLIFLYMQDMTIGLSRKKSKIFLLCLPAVISILLILLTMPKLYFVHGKSTNYSMGLPVYTCYIFCFLYIILILLQVLVHGKSIEHHKRFSIQAFSTVSLVLFFVQVVFPESLVTSLFSTLLILGIYINGEDPFIVRITNYNQLMVMDFATIVESRDDSTGGHIKRTQKYVEIILEEMKNSPEYASSLTKDYLKNVSQAAPLHDIGKISTPDNILQKPGRLTPEEFEIMKQHAAKGSEMVSQLISTMDNPNFEKIAYEVARYHHEKWNGKGYPEGLVGKQIPLHARIMAVADVFDAVSAKRCYRDAMPIEKCFEIIKEGSGTDFDPEIVNVFINAKEKVLQVYNEEKKEC